MKKSYNISELKQFLTDFGLTKKQAAVYLASLQLGPVSIQAIAKAAKTQRTNLYDAVEELIERGLMAIVPFGKRNHYQAQDPTALKSLLHEKERALKDTLPQFASLYDAGETKPHIRYYPGLEGYKQAYEDSLTTTDKKLIGIFSTQSMWEVIGRQAADDMVTRRIKKCIALRVIRSKVGEPNRIYPSSLGDLREMRWAPSGMEFPITTYVYDNKVMILSSKRETFGLIIESADIAAAHRHYFSALWQLSTPDRPDFCLPQFQN
ncbi:MAG: hypothetical protein COU11_03465 [Candidatus Harrisonbacteria bacterium CG10_big_fil_rev_8_21_14_0_10_49_15]|uniref:Transcription regulator TrmB N-terminal domain-containing protein n=1 Tax=Candidatus Harrisonbacteria bacterium CG10_big_fil_rev_8_21_14_0_10_49_15 TaxID=1974587 RepID=A0A2H0UMI3_9BACT|nr:MAG: hypothetical protein COU11_03465 [Candidatus Harrisonbacteria bacterium CG10_big_fil_rev_8_21_14_0_10_49_15]